MSTTPKGQDPKDQDPQGRDPKGRHLPRPLAPPGATASGLRCSGVHLAVRPCETRQRSALQVCDALVVEHLPFAAKVAANFARRTGHPREDLEQLAAIGLIKASRRYDDKRINNSKSNFIAYARPFVNGEITHYLRDKGFLISVPGRWRELHARGQKLIREGTSRDLIPELLGLTASRWAEIVEACAVRVIAMNQMAEEEDL
jgi:RNA polymerase sigma factor (sigma-70 family)